MMIQQQTFDLKESADELKVIAAVIHLLSTGQQQQAVEVLIARHDFLMREPTLKAYGT